MGPQGFGPPQPPAKKGLSGWAIALIVLGVVVVLAIVGVAFAVMTVHVTVVEATTPAAPGHETLATTHSA